MIPVCGNVTIISVVLSSRHTLAGKCIRCRWSLKPIHRTLPIRVRTNRNLFYEGYTIHVCSAKAIVTHLVHHGILMIRTLCRWNPCRTTLRASIAARAILNARVTSASPFRRGDEGVIHNPAYLVPLPYPSALRPLSMTSDATQFDLLGKHQNKQ